MRHILVREIRDASGELLMTWARCFVAEICDECSDPIWPGAVLVVREETGLSGHCRVFSITRHYCEPCGKLLEDSLITTEAQ